MPRPENYSEPEEIPPGNLPPEEPLMETEEDEDGELGILPDSRRYALGIAVDQATGLPRVTAMGRGLMAARMIKAARDAGVPVEEDPELVGSMFRPSDNRAIPSRTYRLIAEILTYIYRLNEAWKNQEAQEQLNKSVDPGEQGEEPENTNMEDTGNK